MNIKNLLKYVIPVAIIGLFIGGKVFADNPNFWLLSNNFLKPLSSSWHLQLPYISSGNCLQTTTAGQVIGSGSACGSGASSSSTIINGLTATNFTFVATNTVTTSFTITTSTAPNLVTINLPQGPYITVCSQGCDFTTNGTNDQTIINNAITKASNGGGGTVFIKHGNYSVATGTQITLLSDVNLLGEGSSTSISINSTSTNGIVLSGINNNIIQNIQLKGGANLSPYGINGGYQIEIINSNNTQIDHNFLTNINGFGIYIPTTGNSTSSKITISNNYLNSNGHQDMIGGGPNAVGITPAQDITIANNQFVSTLPAGGTINNNVDANCVDIVQALRVNFTGNTCFGRIVLGSEKYPNSYNNIVNNIINSPTSTSTLVSSSIVIDQSTAVATTIPQSLIITNNNIQNGRIIVKGSAAASVSGALINNNSLTEPSSSYQDDDTSGVIVLSRVTASQVNDNNATSSQAGSTGIRMTNVTNTEANNNVVSGFLTCIDGGSGSGNTAQGNTLTGCGTTYNNIGYTNLTSASVLTVGSAFTLSNGTHPLFQELSGSLGAYPTVSLGRVSDELRIAIPDNSGEWFNDAKSGDLVMRMSSTTLAKMLLGPGTATSTLAINYQGIGINTTTPGGVLSISGIAAATTPLLVVASATGPSLFTIGSNGSTTIANLGTGCVAAVSGALYGTGVACGTGSGGSGNSAFTIGPSIIFNATSTDNVGIGTTSPVARLAVVGSIIQKGSYARFGSQTPPFPCGGDFCADLVGSDNTLFGVNVAAENLNTGSLAYSFIGANNALQNGSGVSGIAGLQFNGPNFASSTAFGTAFNRPNLGALFNTDGALTLITASTTGDNYISFVTNGVATSTNERMRITGAGLVGIGTTTPAFALDVAGSTIRVTATSSDSSLVVAKGSGKAAILAGGNLGVGFNFDDTGKFSIGKEARSTINAGTFSGTDLFTVLNSGFVGIGSTAPVSTLMLQSTSTQTSSIFTIATSTGASLFNIDANGLTTLQPTSTSTAAFLIKNPSGQTVLQVDQTSTVTKLNIGTTTTPSLATLLVQGSTASTTMPFFDIASSSGATLFQIDSFSHKLTGGATPTCGSGCSSVTGDDQTMRVIVGSSISTATVNFSHTYSLTPVCIATEESAGTTTTDASSTPATVVLEFSAALTTKTVSVICQQSVNFTN